VSSFLAFGGLFMLEALLLEQLLGQGWLSRRASRAGQ